MDFVAIVLLGLTWITGIVSGNSDRISIKAISVMFYASTVFYLLFFFNQGE